MIRRPLAFAIILALSVLAPLAQASADPAKAAGFDLGPFRSGMPLDDLRHFGWPAGSRLLCSGDADLPAHLVTPPRDGIMLPPRMAGRGIVLCALFAPDAAGNWSAHAMDFAGAPTQIWLLALADKEAGGAVRLVQAKLWQSEDAFKATVDFLTGRLGPADFANAYGARWAAADSEVIIGHQSTGGISTILTDKRLEAVIREMTGEGAPDASAPAHGAKP